MFRVHPIHSLDLPELAPYRTLKYQMEHRQQGIFVAESEKVTRRLLESSLAVVSVMLTEAHLPAFEPLLSRRPEPIEVYVGPKSLLETLTGFSMYQGVMAVGRVPASPSLDQLLIQLARPWLLVAADGVANAQNMGALLRNCAAFGGQALLAGESSCSPYLRRSVASSVGTIFRLPVLELKSLGETLRELRRRGIRCLAAHPREGSLPLPQTNLRCDLCLVLGGEGHGLSPAALEQCDETVIIPMRSGIDSLNVAAASAVLLYEAARQRA